MWQKNIRKCNGTFYVYSNDIHKTPGPLSICHWNLSGLPTDNLLKKTLLQAFLCVNNFDIVVLGETHLTSKIDNNDLEIEGYSFERSDHPDDDARGGIGIYYKSSLPCIFKPELTTLNETLVFQVKNCEEKFFLPACIEIHQMKIIEGIK